MAETKMSDVPAIEFDCAVIKVQTMADGAPRAVLEMPEDAIPAMAMLAECQRQGIYLHAILKAAIPHGRESTGNDRPRTKRKISKRD